MSIEHCGGAFRNGWDPWHGRGRATPRLASAMMEELDADDSGSLSASEAQLSETAFAALDSDGDGDVSKRELRAGLRSKRDELTGLMRSGTDDATGTGETPAPATDATLTTAGTVGAMASRIAQRIVDILDADDGGGLSQPESGLDQNRFARLDTNGDGSVTANEFGGSLQQMLDVMGALHALSSVARNSYGRRAYGMAAREAVERYEGNMGGLMAALFETAPTGSTGATTGTSGAVAATGGTASGDGGSTTDASSGAVGDIADVLADAAAAEAAQAATGAAGATA